MRKTDFNDKRIIAILKEAEVGVPARDLCRKYGVSKTTFYRLREKYGEARASGAPWVRQIEKERRRAESVIDATRRSTFWD